MRSVAQSSIDRAPPALNQLKNMADDISNSQLPMGSYGDDITPKNRASPGYNSNIFDGPAD